MPEMTWPALFFLPVFQCANGGAFTRMVIWGKGVWIRKVFTFAPFILLYNFVRGTMKDDTSYMRLILIYKRNAIRNGNNPTKVYLTTDQIAELLADCMFHVPIVRMDTEPMTILGLTIVNVDLL